eukprot:UN00368
MEKSKGKKVKGKFYFFRILVGLVVYERRDVTKNHEKCESTRLFVFGKEFG